MSYIESLRTLQSEIREDRAANVGRSARTLLWLFRVARATQALPAAPRLLASPLRIAYRVVSTTVLGAEIPLNTQIGPGLALPHCRGLVVHEAAAIGPASTLRHNVTIGVRRSGESTPGYRGSARVSTSAPARRSSATSRSALEPGSGPARSCCATSPRAASPSATPLGSSRRPGRNRQRVVTPGAGGPRRSTRSVPQRFDRACRPPPARSRSSP